MRINKTSAEVFVLVGLVAVWALVISRNHQLAAPQLQIPMAVSDIPRVLPRPIAFSPSSEIPWTIICKSNLFTGLLGIASAGKPGVSWRRTTLGPLVHYPGGKSLRRIISLDTDELGALPALKKEPSQDLIVRVDQSSKDLPLALQEQLAKRLTDLRLQPPAERLKHYQEVGMETENFLGWSGRIMGAEATEDGYLVTLRVALRLSMMADSHYITERYALIGDQARFLGADIKTGGPSRMIVGF